MLAAGCSRFQGWGSHRSRCWEWDMLAACLKVGRPLRTEGTRMTLVERMHPAIMRLLQSTTAKRSTAASGVAHPACCPPCDFSMTLFLLSQRHHLPR
jgi:hypothetical protein